VQDEAILPLNVYNELVFSTEPQTWPTMTLKGHIGHCKPSSMADVSKLLHLSTATAL